MADFGKIRRGGLGAPPPPDEASPNLLAPEVAPAEPVSPPPPKEPEPEPQPVAAEPVRPAPIPPVRPETPPAASPGPAIDHQPRPRRDGRTMRRTNRTVAFATRVSEAWDNRIRDIAERDGLMLVEVLERALDAYEKAR